MKTPETKMRISRSVAAGQPVVEGDVDCLLGKSVVRKAWVSGETVWSYLTSIQNREGIEIKRRYYLYNGRQVLPHHRRIDQC